MNYTLLKREFWNSDKSLEIASPYNLILDFELKRIKWSNLNELKIIFKFLKTFFKRDFI